MSLRVGSLVTNLNQGVEGFSMGCLKVRLGLKGHLVHARLNAFRCIEKAVAPAVSVGLPAQI